MKNKYLIFFSSCILCFTSSLKGQVTKYIKADTIHVMPLYDTLYCIAMKHRTPGTFSIYTDSSFTRKIHEISYGNIKDRYGVYHVVDTVRNWYLTGQKKKIEWYLLENGKRMRFPSAIEYYRSGKTKQKTFYASDSLWITHSFYESGSVRTIDTNKCDDQGDVFWIKHEEYCENGQRTQSINENSLEIQEIIIYDCDGRIFQKSFGNYKGAIGLFQGFYPNGKISIQGNFEKQESGWTDKSGRWEYFTAEGKKVKEEYYEKGKLIREVRFD